MIDSNRRDGSPASVRMTTERETQGQGNGASASVPTPTDTLASVGPPSHAFMHASQPVPSGVAPETLDLKSPAFYLNRELSWLEFNARVLSEAEQEAVPLFERVKFHAIFASNLDEFFMVRVAGLKQQLTGEVEDLPADGLTANEQLDAIARRVHELSQIQQASLEKQIFPALREQGYVLLKPNELPPEQLLILDERFKTEIFPILTPIAIDPGHPFPQVRNKALNLGVMFQREGAEAPGFGVVPVPPMLPRLVEVGTFRAPDGRPRTAYVLLEDVLARYVAAIFPGAKLRGVYTFRVTRNFDMEIDEEEADDLLQEIQQELRRRERGNAVRLEVSREPSPDSLVKLAFALKLDPVRDVYHVGGMLNVYDLLSMVPKDGRRDLRDEPFTPPVVPPLREADDLFAILRDRDVLLHHPYESFDPVVELISRAAEDPDVLAIKQTVYRAGGDSPIVKALARAAEAGKQVTAIVELKARFDEASNIVWARTLEQSGVHVVYGLMGLKTHAKCLLIVRREKGGLRRYAHLGTGNYNAQTARIYTDFGLLTSRPNICEDVSSLFNLLTGYSAPPRWNSLVVAPLGLHEAVMGLILREAEHARAGRPARIIAKMNSLVDEHVIEALYRASQAGVQITLLVRGICCLRPGIPGVSENIEVRALIDRYLEHARAFYFANGGAGREEVYLSSADWMPRNFFRRVEVMIPVEDATIRNRILEILQTTAADSVKSWTLGSDGIYERVGARAVLAPLRSQQRFVEQVREVIKGAEQTVKTTGLFHLLLTSRTSPTVEESRRRRRRKKVD